ncbi:hypothetical protein GT037_006040 [Alternaria burnsii]|uniref:Uncharacterized protein n=1 Tax=Alternaria burnsii TaxID=1187904 RepID=A0A8H7EFL6_9PLEO|nr:uncharacterized protein GT037_006040 [Alternaria burnsii]KAF7676535.1 hypothetical protein GT037_006040 [Alternaria burnsii]
MPFRDQEWEELQRDCDIFPAYSDYLYGPDPRIITTQEPGLHPMIYPIDASAPIRYTNSMPSRTWSHKTTEDLERLKNATAQTLLAGQNEPGSDMSGANNGTSTPGSYVRPQTGSLLNPLLPPQSVCTISEEEMARRKTLNASRRRRRSQTVVPFSSSQQQPVGMTGHQMHTRNTPVIHSGDVEPQQPSFLRSSSTTDIDETLVQMDSRQKSDALSSFASQTTMLPPPANLSQRQPLHAIGLSNNLPPIPAPNNSPEPSQQTSLLQPNDVLRNSRYDCINPAKRLEIAKVLVDRWVVVRNSAADDALGVKAMSDIRNITRMVNNSVTNMQAAMDLQQQRTQQLHMQAVPKRAQTDHIQHIQQRQPTTPTPQEYAQPQPQPGIWSAQLTQSSPIQPPWQPASQESYCSVPQVSQQMQLPQQSIPQDFQTHQQPQQRNQEQYEQFTSQNINLSPAQLHANTSRHIPEMWRNFLITQNTSLPLQDRMNARQWMVNLKNNLPVEAHTYMVQVLQRAMREHSQGRDALAFLKTVNMESNLFDGGESKHTSAQDGL